jgi:hypothetical protein
MPHSSDLTETALLCREGDCLVRAGDIRGAADCYRLAAATFGDRIKRANALLSQMDALLEPQSAAGIIDMTQ